MNLTQFLRAYGVEQFSRWGCNFNFEEDAIKVFGCFPQETQPEQFGLVILFNAYEDYDIYNRCVAKGAEPMSFGDWRSLLFLSCDQAQLAVSRLREQLRTFEALPQSSVVELLFMYFVIIELQRPKYSVILFSKTKNHEYEHYFHRACC
jgi:hypothetical protein